MPVFQATVTVALKPDILDPAGEATSQVLQHLGFSVHDLRIGRHIRFSVAADSLEDANLAAERMAQEVLANPVMETYDVQVAPA